MGLVHLASLVVGRIGWRTYDSIAAVAAASYVIAFAAATAFLLVLRVLSASCPEKESARRYHPADSDRDHLNLEAWQPCLLQPPPVPLIWPPAPRLSQPLQR